MAQSATKRRSTVKNRLRTLGMVLALIGMVFVVAGGVAFFKVQDGYDSLQSFSEAQNVTLAYNDDGQLLDRGSPEEAQAILTMLTTEGTYTNADGQEWSGWGYPAVMSDLDPNDPLVNTATEYMYQMAVIGYHVLHGTQTITLTEAVEYNGETFAAGTYEFPVEGRYWTDFDRRHPIEGPARSATWTGTAHGLFAELGVGTVTHSALQMGLAISGLFAGVGFLSLIAGAGMIWVGRGTGDEQLVMLAAEGKKEDATV